MSKLRNLVTQSLRTPNSYAPLPLRLILGVVFVTHGAGKLFGVLGGYGLEGSGQFFESIGLAPGVFWAAVAGTGELAGGVLVLTGLLTRLGAINLVVTMTVAMLTAHSGFLAPTGIEFPLTLWGASLALAISGGGAYSLDRLWFTATPTTQQPQLSAA